MVDPDDGDRQLPHEVFQTLGNETRLRILHVLWEAHDPLASSSAMSFSALRERVGTPDSGQFNYHLGQLTDGFVVRTDGGYELTYAGLSLVQTLLGGTAVDAPALDPVRVDQPCPYCGADVVVAYEDGLTHISCSACTGTWENSTLGTVPFPPAGVRGRSTDDLPAAAYHWNVHRFQSLMDGVCPQCAGTTAVRTDVCTDHAPDERGRCPACERRYGAIFTATCRTCKHAHRGPFRSAVLSEQAVAAFYHDHGIAFDAGSFDAFLLTRDARETLVSAEPFRLEVALRADDEELRLVLDDALDLVETSREPAT